VTAQQITYLYFIRSLIRFFVRDVNREFGLISMYLFDNLPAISSGKVGDFFPSGYVLLCRLATSSPGAPAHRIFTVCISVDEQFAHARDSLALCRPAVGHIPRMCHLLDRYLIQR